MLLIVLVVSAPLRGIVCGVRAHAVRKIRLLRLRCSTCSAKAVSSGSTSVMTFWSKSRKLLSLLVGGCVSSVALQLVDEGAVLEKLLTRVNAKPFRGWMVSCGRSVLIMWFRFSFDVELLRKRGRPRSTLLFRNRCWPSSRMARAHRSDISG